MINSLSQFNINKLLDSFPDSRRILIAYSGGIDSSVLLHLLCSIRSKLKQALEVIYIDHGLQKESSDWGEFCRQECIKYNVPFALMKINESCPENLSVEGWARDKRYSLISKLVRKNDILFTAHHQDDQVETFFLQIFRSAGPRGLSSMPVFKKFGDGFHARPFLIFSRKEIEKYAKNNNISWQEDNTNCDIRYDRNYLRHNILAELDNKWPSYRKSVCRTINHQKECLMLIDEIGLEDMTAVLYKNSMNLNIKLIKKFSIPRQKNIIFFWLNSLNFEKPTSKHMDQIMMTLINSRIDKTPCVNWRNTEIRRYGDLLYASRIINSNDLNLEINWNTKTPLNIHGETLIANETFGRGISKTTIKDAEIVIRYRHGGEKIYSNSIVHSKSIKKLFQEHRVLPWFRNRIPLIYINKQLAVVPGFCIDKNFSANENETALDIHWSGYDKVIQPDV